MIKVLAEDAIHEAVKNWQAKKDARLALEKAQAELDV